MNKLAKELLSIANSLKNIYGEEIDIGEEYQKESGNRTFVCLPKIYTLSVEVLKDEIDFNVLNKLINSLTKELKYELEDLNLQYSNFYITIEPNSSSDIKIVVKANLNNQTTEDVLLKNGYKRLK